MYLLPKTARDAIFQCRTKIQPYWEETAKLGSVLHNPLAAKYAGDILAGGLQETLEKLSTDARTSIASALAILVTL